MSVSRQEERILEALLFKVRVMASSQLEQLVGDGVASLMRSLSRKQYVESLNLRTQILELASPLFSWSPTHGDVTPDFWKISWQAESRFNSSRTGESRVFFATDLACRHFGGVGGKLRQPFQMLHDLGTASMFVAKATLSSEHSIQWIGEDVIRRYFRHLKVRKIPDAASITESQVSRVFEFAGRDYSGSYIKSFHEFWKRKNTPYEIW